MSESKNWYIFTMKYCAVERKKEPLAFATAGMKLKSIMLSEINQVMKEKYHLISTYKWHLFNKTNKQAKYNQRH